MEQAQWLFCNQGIFVSAYCGAVESVTKSPQFGHSGGTKGAVKSPECRGTWAEVSEQKPWGRGFSQKTVFAVRKDQFSRLLEMVFFHFCRVFFRF